MVFTLKHNFFWNGLFYLYFKLFLCIVAFYTYITYNFVAVDFTSNICQNTYPVAVLQTAE
jgi:hypothetical protein